jgi:AcrR family transcriptional regulator
MPARPKAAPAAAAVSTSDRLKDAAIQLFARDGLEAVSVRDIAAAANLKNAGSLNYYFRSKEELIRQLVAKVMGTADAYWKAGLEDLQAQAAPPSVRDIVRVIVSWPVPASGAGRTPSTARFLAMFVQNRRETLRDLMRELGFVHYDRAFALLRVGMGAAGVPTPVANQRLVFLFWSSTAFLAAREAAMDSDHAEHTLWSTEDVLENFIDAMVGMLTAPVTRAARTAKPKRGA